MIDENEQELPLIRVTDTDDVSQLILDETHSIVFVFNVHSEVMEISYTSQQGKREKIVMQQFFSSTQDSQMIHPDYGQLFKETVERITRTKKTEILEYLGNYDEQGYSWYRAVFRSVKNKEDGNQYLIGIAQSIDIEKHAESLIKSFTENEYDFIMFIQPDNDAYSIYSPSKTGSSFPSLQFSSYENDRIKNTMLYVIEEDRDRVIDQMSLTTVCRELEKNPVYSVFMGVREKDGRISRKKVTYSYIQKEQKLIRVTRSDVTLLYEQEQEKRDVLRQALVSAEQASLAKTQFLSRMSHEMRTPMNAIMALITLVQHQLDQNSPVQENLHKIQTSAHYLLSIINDVLDMARIESGKMTLVKEKIVIKDFISKVNAVILPQARAKNILYESTIHDSVFYAFLGDTLKLQQVLVNILGNAVKFTPGGGRVSLHLEQIFFLNTEQKRKLRFTISDTGIGIEKKYIGRIFDSFTQQDSSISSTFGGTGLGLAITKNLLNMMGGSISVKSRKGEGSVFTVEVVLPIYQDIDTKKEGKEEAQDESHQPGYPLKYSKSTDFYKGKRLLLVDDNEMNIDVAKQLLMRRGFTVDTAENGKDAVDLFEKSTPSYYSAILMDVRMPVMDGLTAARLIRSSKHDDSKRIPIIAMTANAFSEDIKMTQESGMNAHLSKPIDVELLYTTLSCLITGTC